MPPLSLGLDVGSTTVKAVLLDEGGAIVARAYRRHRGDPAGTVGGVLGELHPGAALVRVALTGSGARPLAPACGGVVVHEVSAITAATARRLPSVQTILELGGQDAKLVVQAGPRAHMTMNDRCAAGTGVTVDRCLFRLGLTAGEAAKVAFDPARIRPVSSKCGVFAETDLCNLARAGLPPADLVVSLCDAIAVQTLAVLARGQPLPGDVALLGGPPVHLPALVGALRHRLEELWRQLGAPPAEVVLPADALLFAAIGAAQLGPARAPAAEVLALEEVAARIARRPGRIESPLDTLLVPPTEPATSPAAGMALAAGAAAAVPAGAVAIGVDAGSTTCKVVAIDASGRPIASASRMSTSPIADARELLAEVEARLQGIPVRALGVTGYGAALLAPVLGADLHVLETVAHARAARLVAPDAEVVCDVGGQDVKILALDGAGRVRDFRISSQCSAGVGMILEATARELGVGLEEFAPLAFAAARAPWFGDSCSVFLDANRVTFQRQGFTAGEILAGLARALPRVVWSQVTNGTAPSTLGRVFVLQGGVQRNAAAVAAQVEHLEREVPGARVVVHPYPSEAGAIGAALCALEAAGEGPRAPRTGAATGASVSLRSDEGTRCHRCASRCPRTFVSIRDGAVAHGASAPAALHVIGNACADGDAPGGGGRSRAAVTARKRARTPNLLAEEVRWFFHPRHAGRPIVAPRALRVGIPRVLSLYRAAPLFRAYLGALGVRDVVFSPVTSDPLWREGARHGASNPCFPVKVVLAHVHHLLHAVHDAGRPLDVLFLPHFTHAMTPVRHAVDTASCPVIAGAPALVAAAFGDELRRRGIRLVAPVVTVTEPQLLRQQMFEAFGELLGVGERESRQAVRAGVAACQWVDHKLEAGARGILDRLDAEPGHGAVLVVGRPYHADPGLNHRVGEELAALGYPVLTVRSVPRTRDRDRAWLEALLGPDVDSGRIADPFDVRDLAPDAANSGVVERLFAARVAARDGRIGVVDLSSFKCGQDSPAHGPLRELLDGSGTPLATLHELDETRPITSLRLRLRTFAHAMQERGLHPWA